jgi:ABC-2 type transport system ATP-binding protein
MGKTVVVSSHVLLELAEMCSQVGILAQGKIVASGPMEDIRRQFHAGRILRTRILAEEEAALDLVRGCAYLGLSEPVAVPDSGRPGTTLEVQFTGDDAALADLLATLVGRGAHIADWHEVGSELEDLFLQLTEAEGA